METNARGNTPSTSGTTGGALNKVSSGAHAVVDSIAGAADEAARKAKPAIEQAAAIAHQGVDKAAGAVAPTADWLAEQGGRLSEKRKTLMQDTCSYVSANPMTALGIAVAAGFLLSRVIQR